MSDPLLNVMKIMLLAGLYLFFVRVLWSVYNELRDLQPAQVQNSRHAAMLSKTEAPARDSKTRFPKAGRHGGRSNGRRSRPTSSARQSPPAPCKGLVVMNPGEPDNNQVVYVGAGIVLGRSTEADVTLDDNFVSSNHARIFEANGRFFVEDLASRNGTRLNGKTLDATTMLVGGDKIQIGATTMEFR